MDGDNVAVGDVPGLDARADAAAVDERHVSAGHGLVSVRAQVAEVRLRHADDALLGVCGVVYHKVNVRVRHDLVHKLLILVLNVTDVALCAAVVEQHGVKLAVRCDGQAADVFKLCAGGGEDDLVAVLIFHKLLFNDGVAVPVEHDVNAGGVRDDIGGRPRRAVGLYAEMRQRYDVVCAVLARGVNGFLHGGVDGLAGLILTEGVYPLAVVVLEVLRRGGGERPRRAYADERDLHTGLFNDGVGVEHGLAVLVVEVCADIVKLRVLHELEELLHAVVELVVARRRHVVAQLVHDVHDVLALGERAYRAALYGVACVGKDDLLALLLKRLLHQSEPLVADVVVNAAVHIVCVQHDDVRALPVGIRRAGAQRERHDERQQQCQKLSFHVFPP